MYAHAPKSSGCGASAAAPHVAEARRAWRRAGCANRLHQRPVRRVLAHRAQAVRLQPLLDAACMEPAGHGQACGSGQAAKSLSLTMNRLNALMCVDDKAAEALFSKL